MGEIEPLVLACPTTSGDTRDCSNSVIASTKSLAGWATSASYCFLCSWNQSRFCPPSSVRKARPLWENPVNAVGGS